MLAKHSVARLRREMRVAALFVDERGVYSGIHDVDVWGITRDARLYPGDMPVVAHPPCGWWSRLAPVNAKRYGRTVGDDGGCFASDLASVRAFGGVLEHPAGSYAWERFGLPRPHRFGWQRGTCGFWVTEVSQRAYGHRAEKLTWLYANVADPPALDWSRPAPEAWCSYLRNHGDTSLPRLTKREASATTPAFRDALLNIARSVLRSNAA